MRQQQKDILVTANSLDNLAVYKYAKHFFTLSRKLNFSQTVHSPSSNLSPERMLTEAVIDISLKIPISIAEASVTRDFTKKLRTQKRLTSYLDQLKSLQKRLTALLPKQADELVVTNEALKKLEESFKIWSIQMTRQN